MPKSSLDTSALALALIAAAAAVLLVPSGFTWLASIAGLLLLVLLLAYDEEGYRSIAQSLAFAGICAFCLTVASVIPYQYIYGLPTPREPQLLNRWLPLTCAFTTLLIWVVDRARMGARVQTAQPGAATLGSVFTPRSTVTSQPMAQEPSPVASSHIEQPQPHLIRSEPVRSEPAFVAPPPAPAPVPLVEIYVHLTGESLNLMRSVQAEPLGREYYRIVDTMPENEMWQFTPGQVVRCKKQNLSTGKAMVAMEEAPRA